jgi:hypothetical protein
MMPYLKSYLIIFKIVILMVKLIKKKDKIKVIQKNKKTMINGDLFTFKFIFIIIFFY